MKPAQRLKNQQPTNGLATYWLTVNW